MSPRSPFTVIWTAFARKALDDIYVHIAEEHSVASAEYVEAGLFAATSTMKKYPEAFAIAAGSSETQVYRKLVKWSYGIYYTLESARSLVVIVDVFHSAREGWVPPS